MNAVRITHGKHRIIVLIVEAEGCGGMGLFRDVSVDSYRRYGLRSIVALTAAVYTL